MKKSALYWLQYNKIMQIVLLTNIKRIILSSRSITKNRGISDALVSLFFYATSTVVANRKIIIKIKTNVKTNTIRRNKKEEVLPMFQRHQKDNVQSKVLFIICSQIWKTSHTKFNNVTK